MARNRRNIRRITNIRDLLNMRTFLTIVGILLAIILFCIGVQEGRAYIDKQLLAKQKEELEKQTQQVFAAIETSITQTNQSISEKDTLIRMSAVGDILCGEAMIEDAYQEDKTYDFSSMFARVSEYITTADVVMGTMETNFANKKYNSENSPKEFAEAVKQSGINLVTISHNHSLDYGLDGLKKTKSTLKKIGYDVVGDKLDSDQAVLIKKVKDTKIAFLTYTYGVNRQASKSKEELKAINLYTEKQAKSDIAYAKKQGAEYICVMIHWGDAISETVNQNQRQIADFLVENDVDMILGAHPSVVQPMEIKKNADGKNVFVAYSIGTYISTLSDDNAKVELVLNIELRKSGKDGKVYLNKVDYTPIYVLDHGEGAENRFELIDMKSVASNYTNGNSAGISRETYDKLIVGLNRLDKILK